MNNPLISVIIPVFNGEKFIAEAIKSVLGQDYDSLEVIVVDDGSKDNTAEIVKSFGNDVTYYFKENGGPSSARNLALEVASGFFMAFLDHDDVFVEGAIEKQLSVYNKYKSPGVVMGALRFNNMKDNSDLYYPGKENHGSMLNIVGNQILICHR